MKIENILNKVINLYKLLRNIIKKSFHLMWRDPLALEPAE